jgi:hypothetical protein
VMPSMPSTDAENNRIYVMDGGVGKLAALELTPDGLKKLWEVKQRSICFTALIGSKAQRIFISTETDAQNALQLRTYSKEFVLWRDAATGREIARSETFSPTTPGVLVTPGFNGVVYYLGYNGVIRELKVAPQ